MRFVSLAGGPTGMDLIVGLAGLYFLWRRYFAAAILSVMGVLGAQLIETLLKSALARTRPHLWTSAQIVHSYSFPSGHASSAAAAAAGIAFGLYLAHGRATAAVAAAVGSLVALTVGFSRLYLGVHWPTDVLGGFALALGWVSLLVLLVRRSGSSIGDRSMASFGRLR
jgi:undecaprenyl-diphosphatase